MANKTYCFVHKKSYAILKKAGKKVFPTHRFLETESSKENAIKAFAKDTLSDVSTVKKTYKCFIYKPSKTSRIY